MSDEKATTPSLAEQTTPPGPGLSLPGLIGKLGLYATYGTAAILVLVLVADAAVVLRNPAPSLLLSLLLSIGPLVALLLSSFASYVNYFGTWRILRRQDEYQASQDLKTHAADLPQALQGVLMRRSGCMPLASCVALVLALVLASLTVVPPDIPVAGAVSAYTGQLGDLLAAAYATPTPSPAVVAAATSTPTALPTPLPTATAIPTATRLPTAVPTPTPTPGPVIKFTVIPTTATWTGCLKGSPPPPVTLKLDNTQSTVAVSWQATAVETVLGKPWASITDAVGNPVASGTVPAGGTQGITVTPANPVEVCRYSNPPPYPWHVSIVTTNGGKYTFTYTVS